MEAIYGRIMEIQNLSVNDGEGIRTTLFLAGCPLHCEWCANPEGISGRCKTAYYEKQCIQCGECADNCPLGVGINLNTAIARKTCTGCGLCVSVCPTGSRKRMVEKLSIDEVMRKIEKQFIFYRYSGGGVTFSGGEATQQYHFFSALANKLYDKGISLALETSGYFDFEALEPTLRKLDLIFVDLKHMDSEAHFKYTGVRNEYILENIKRINALGIKVVVRVPVIEGVNAEMDNIVASAKFVKQFVTNPEIELLPYHTLGEVKYEALGLAVPPKAFGTPSAEKMNSFVSAIEAEGVKHVKY